MATGSEKHTINVDSLIQDGIVNLCQEIFKSSANINIYGLLLVQADEQNNLIMVQRKLSNPPSKPSFPFHSQASHIDAAIDLSQRPIGAISPDAEDLGMLVIAGNPDETDSDRTNSVHASQSTMTTRLRKLSHSSSYSLGFDEHPTPPVLTAFSTTCTGPLNPRASNGSLADLGAIPPIRELKESLCELPLSQESGVLAGDTPSPSSVAASCQLALQVQHYDYSEGADADSEAELKTPAEEFESAPGGCLARSGSGSGSLLSLERTQSQVQVGSLPPVPEQCACPVEGCAQEFDMRHELSAHLDDVHKETLCAWCSRHFSTRQNLKRHERLHTGHKPYVCSQCDERFHRRDALVTHVNRIHPGSEHPPSGSSHMASAEAMTKDEAMEMAMARPEPMAMAMYAQSQLLEPSAQMQTTKLSDSGAGARGGYKCKLCQSELIDRDTFRDHMLAAHDKPNLVFCPHCDFVFDARQGFLDHLRRDHPTDLAASVLSPVRSGGPETCATAPAATSTVAALTARKREFEGEVAQSAGLPFSPTGPGPAAKQPSLQLRGQAFEVPGFPPQALVDYYRQLASMFQAPSNAPSAINRDPLHGFQAVANAPICCPQSVQNGQHAAEQQQQQMMALAFLKQMLTTPSRSLQAPMPPTSFLSTLPTSNYTAFGDPRLKPFSSTQH